MIDSAAFGFFKFIIKDVYGVFLCVKKMHYSDVEKKIVFSLDKRNKKYEVQKEIRNKK